MIEPNKAVHNVLIIDDEEAILHALDRVLGREGYRIFKTNQPNRGIDILESESIDVVITDLLMEGLTGLDITQWVQENKPDLPVILITGNPDLHSAQEAVRFKAFDYIPKPVERAKILDVVKRAVEQKVSKEESKKQAKETQERADTLNRRYQDLHLQNSIILDTTMDCVITISKSARIFSVNRAAQEKFGSPDRPLINQNVSLLYPKDKTKVYSRYMDFVMRHQMIPQGQKITEIELIDNQGARLYCEVSLCKYTIDNELFYTGIIRDTTEKKLMTQKLIESEKLAVLNTIAASIGHEINNALTAIMGFVELAISPTADEEIRKRTIQVTFSQGEKLRNLTYNLLTLGKQKDGWFDESEEHTDLNLCLEEVLSVFEKSKRIKNCEIILEKVGTPIIVIGSQEKIGLVFSNLILNAADATKNMGKIELRTFWDHSEPCFSIRDNGMGMTPEILAKIYEPYFSTKGVGKGTGLGMFVVKEIAHLYGIRIQVETVVNQGTTFTLRFHRYEE